MAQDSNARGGTLIITPALVEEYKLARDANDEERVRQILMSAEALGLLSEGASTNAEEDCSIVMAEFVDAVYKGDEERISRIISSNPTLLHLVAKTNLLGFVELLLHHGATVNAVDEVGITPLHMAAQYASKEVVSVLLKNGAMFDAVDDLGTKAVDIAKNEEIKNLLLTTESVYESVVSNNLAEVIKQCIAGAIIESKNSEGDTPLHQAAQRGFEKVVKILLRNGAQVNVHGSEGFTPLHFAVKMSHISITKLLLFHGAFFEAVDDNGKSPSCFCVDGDLTKLLELIRTCFEKIKRNDETIIRDIKRIDDTDTRKALFGAKNKEKMTLVHVAISENFGNLREFRKIVQADALTLECNGLDLMHRGKYEEGLDAFKVAFEKRKELLGPDNPFTLDVQSCIAGSLNKLGNYSESLKINDEICRKQTEMFGFDALPTLRTRNGIALDLCGQGCPEEALDMFDEIHRKQSELLGADAAETVETLLNKALALNGLQRYEEALDIYQFVYKERTKNLKGGFTLQTLIILNKIGKTLQNLRRYEEALAIFEDVFKKRKTALGLNHDETIKSKFDMTIVLAKMGKNSEAIKAFEEILKLQKNIFPSNHPRILMTKFALAHVYLSEKMDTRALNMYKRVLEPQKAVLGIDHYHVQDCMRRIELITHSLELAKISESRLLDFNNRGLKEAIVSNDEISFVFFMDRDSDKNQRDPSGRTLLHLAVENCRMGFVGSLLAKGADLSHTTVNGNTALHTATLKGSKEIVEMLLKEVERLKLDGFVDAQTTSTATTALHVAAKNGLSDIVTLLLNFGANHEIVDKDGKRPIDLATDEKVKSLLTLEID